LISAKPIVNVFYYQKKTHSLISSASVIHNNNIVSDCPNPQITSCLGNVLADCFQYHWTKLPCKIVVCLLFLIHIKFNIGSFLVKFKQTLIISQCHEYYILKGLAYINNCVYLIIYRTNVVNKFILGMLRAPRGCRAPGQL